MAINKKLIHFKTRAAFDVERANENILDTSIVFIKDSQEIYTHGQIYSCKPEVLATLNNDGLLSKADKAKIEWLVNNGDGSKYLSDDGTYKKVPSKVSELENDSEYLTEHQDISHLATKEEMGNKADKTELPEIVDSLSSTDALAVLSANQGRILNEKINALTEAGFKVQIVDLLPETGEINTIYFILKNDNESEDDVYNEYMFINEGWELIGNTAVDLEGYIRNVNGEVSVEGSMKGITTLTASDNATAKAFLPSKLTSGTALDPGVFYNLGVQSELTVTFNFVDASIMQEYMFQFTASENGCILNLPEGIKWACDNVIEANKTYQVSVLENIVIMAGA